MRKSKQRVILSLFILSICCGITVVADPSSPCGDWEAYKDEKCFKVSDEYGTEEEAEKICNQGENSATLVIISSKDEQDFLSNLLFKIHKVVDNVWIGAKHTSNKFKWIDASDLSFTNWVKGSPQNETGHDCVQMISDASSMGKWIDESCGRKNLVVCQKMQTLSLSLLQKTLLDARKEFEDVTKQLSNSLSDTIKKLNTLEQNPVPIGFIYAQLPSQPEPKTLWPAVEWKDVTSDYAGLFFRAEGDGSAAFGTLQNENAPRVVQVRNRDIYHPGPKTLDIGTWSDWIYTGADTNCDSNTCVSLSFETSGEEVRPRNKAIRIWRRTN